MKKLADILWEAYKIAEEKDNEIRNLKSVLHSSNIEPCPDGMTLVEGCCVYN